MAADGCTEESCSSRHLNGAEERSIVRLYDVWTAISDSETAGDALNQTTVDIIFAVLTPRCSESKNEQSDKGEQSVTLELALQCFVQAVQLIHQANPQQHCEVDVPTLLKRFLQVLRPRDMECVDDNETSLQTISLLGAIPRILNCEDKAVLKAIFLGIGCFQDIVQVLATLVRYKCIGEPSDCAVQNSIAITVIHAIWAIMDSSPPAREVFKDTVGYSHFCEYLKQLKEPSRECIAALLEWAVEGSVVGENRLINNVDIVLMLFEWLPSLQVEHQRYVAGRLSALCHSSTHNAMVCSVAGVFGRAVRVLDNQVAVDDELAVSLIGLLEAIGSHSVTSSEFKQMIGLFRPQGNGSRSRHTHTLLQALVKMAASGGKTRAKHYFDLHHASSGITVPSIQKWSGGGFTFHAWIYLETPHHGNEETADQKRPQCRRQLYSFFSASGNGLEAFLTAANKLVVAVCCKKEYITATLPHSLFSDHKWHSVAVVHCPRRTFGNSTVVVYVDGEAKLSCPMRFPTLSEELVSCHIGSGGPQTVSHAEHASQLTGKQSFRFSLPFINSVAVDTANTPGAAACVIQAGTQDDVWGVPCSIEGQLGPVCVFHEGLQESNIKQLYLSGPNDLNLFQPLDATGAAKSVLAGLGCKLVLYYNSKAGCDHVCCDLTPPQPGHVPLHGRLTGHRCFTWDMKDVFNSIGGVNVFLPLLEQIYCQEQRRSVSFTIGPDEVSSKVPAGPMELRGNGVVTEEKAEIETFSDVCEYNRNRSCSSLTAVSSLTASTAPSRASLASVTSVSSVTSSTFDKRERSPDQPERGFKGEPDEWILIDRSRDIRLFGKEVKEICDSPSCSEIALYIYLLLGLLREDEIHEHSHATIVQYVGSMLQRSNVGLIDVHVLRSVQALVECVTPGHRELMDNIYRDLVFDFSIWSFSEFEVRIGHLQYLSTLIKDSPSRFRDKFGVKFLLDVIRLYYSEDGALLSDNNGNHRAGAVGVKKIETKAIRGSLVGLVKYYLNLKVKREEVGFVVEYLASTSDADQVVEVLDVLLSLCDRGSSNKMVKRLSDPEHVHAIIALLRKHNAKKLHLKVLRIVSDILMSHQVLEATKDSWRLKEVGFSALTEALSQDVSDELVKALMMLGVSEMAEDKGVAIYGHYDVVLAVVRMIRNEGLGIKLYITHLILRSMDASQSSVAKCAKIPGWHYVLFKLITREQAPHQHNGLKDVEEREKEEQALVDTVLEIIFRVMWKGIEGYDKESWRQRGQPIAAVSRIASDETFLRPPRVIERNLLELCVLGALEDINRSGETGVSQTMNAVQVMKLVNDFLFTPAAIAGTAPNEDQFTWSIRLVDGVDQLLEALNVWDDTEGNTEWVEMAQAGIKILMTFISCREPEFCATASSKLSKLLKSRTLHSQGEICYILGNLYKAYVTSRETHDCRNFTFIIPVIRMVLLRYREHLPLTIYIPSFMVPDRNYPQFEEDFVQLVSGDEFKAFVKQQINPSMKQYETSFLQSLMVSGRFWMECLTGLTLSLSQWEQACQDSKEYFEEKILIPFKKLQDKQKEYAKQLVKQREHHQAVVRAMWDQLKYDLTSERAAWGSRTPGKVHWKLSTTETFQRMRLKLTQNHSFDPHTEASRSHDAVDGGPWSEIEEDENALPLNVAKEAVVHDAVDDKLDVESEESINTYSPPNSPGTERRQTLTEKQVLSVACELITLMDVVPGRLEITNLQVYFCTTRNGGTDSGDTADRDFQWSLTELREVHLRRYNLRRSALEFFLVDQTNYFINFDKETRNMVYKRVMSMKPPHLYYTGSRSPAQLLKASGLTQKWVRREISNFEYLMQLNTIAGRTYNDLSQYPVFPWILSDYSCQELDLSNPSVYRDLSKPVGVLNPAKVAEVQGRYKDFEDPSGTIAKFHYGTHYSNAAGVLHYLIRVEPFTTLHIKLQSGRFDCPNRQFHNVSGLWHSIYDKGSDVKELIPEFFYFPEMFMNMNKFDLGRLHSGEEIDDVVLPKWASSPEDFVYKHRQALESEHVSRNLHQWIDLIFGYKQKGPAAVEAMNVFYYCTYEGAVDLDAIIDPFERQATEGMINNFGQTPSQLLTEPHPQRMSPEDAAATNVVNVGVTAKPLASIFCNFDKWKAYFVNVANAKDPLVFTAVPKIQVRSLIHTGMPDQMVTVSQSGILGTQDWLPYSKSRMRPFTFELDPSLAVGKLRRCLAGPFAPDLVKSPKLFAITHDAKLIITVGHWDNSIRVFSSKGKLLTRIVAHTDVVTCLSLDNDGRHLMCGSRDTTSTIWTVAHQSGLAQEMSRAPIQTLYGHDDEVTCVAVSWELDVAISGSKDGTCIIHTTRIGQYVRSLRPGAFRRCSSPSPLHITALALSEFGDVVMFCREVHKNMLCLYSVNGKQLSCDDSIACEVEDMVISGEYLITGDKSTSGRLVVRLLHSFKVVKKMHLRVPIRCVSLAKDNTHVFACLDDGKLIIIALSEL